MNKILSQTEFSQLKSLLQRFFYDEFTIYKKMSDSIYEEMDKTEESYFDFLLMDNGKDIFDQMEKCISNTIVTVFILEDEYPKEGKVLEEENPGFRLI